MALWVATVRGKHAEIADGKKDDLPLQGESLGGRASVNTLTSSQWLCQSTAWTKMLAGIFGSKRPVSYLPNRVHVDAGIYWVT